MTAHTPDPPVDVHEMRIYRSYFDLIASGRKTTEVRVNDARRRSIKAGALIRFRCQGDEALVRVTRVAHYPDFDALFATEPVEAINPLATREQQLAAVRQIYPPDREALGAVAIGIKFLDRPLPM